MSRNDTIGKTATSVFGQGMKMVVRYHDTNVVEFDDKEIKLNSGGWRTKTTKLRMNQASNQFDLGFQVIQKDWDWFVLFNGETLNYQDGMILQRKGGYQDTPKTLKSNPRELVQGVRS